MPRSLAIVALILFLVSGVGAQEKLPPRFAPLTKNERFRLVRVLGMPELQPTLQPTSAISADGKWAIFAEDITSSDGKNWHFRTRLLLFDLQAKTWPREFEIDGKTVTALDLSQDGAKVLLAGQFIDAKGKDPSQAALRAHLLLLDLRTGKAVRSIEAADMQFLCVALAPDGTFALTGLSDKIKQWDLRNGKQVAVYDAKRIFPIHALTFLPGGKQFLAAGDGVRLWIVGMDKPVRSFAVNPAVFDIWRLAVTSDCKQFTVGELMAVVTQWDIASGKQTAKLSAYQGPHDEFITGLAITADGKTVIGAWSSLNKIAEDSASTRFVAWDAETRKTLWSKTTRQRGLMSMLMQKDKLLLGGGANLFETWSIKEGKQLECWGGHKGSVNAVAVLLKGDILSAGQEGVVMTWRDGKMTRSQPTASGAISVLAQSHDRTQWLSAAADHAIRLYAGDGDKPLQVLKGHTGSITSLAFGKEGWAVSGSGGSGDRAVKTWDLKSGKEIASFVDHSEGVNAVAVSPDDKWLATGSDDTTIRLWPIKAGKVDLTREAITLEGHKKPVTCLAFSPDGKTLISGSQDQTLKVWDWAKEKAVRTIPGHKNWITSLLLIPSPPAPLPQGAREGLAAVTTSDDLTLRWWDLDSGKEVGRLDFGVIGDCPRCLARLGADRLLVGTSSWLIYELQMLPTDNTNPKR